jgi:hypothetical protein
MEGIQFLAAAIVAGLAAIGAGLGFGMMGGSDAANSHVHHRWSAGCCADYLYRYRVPADFPVNRALTFKPRFREI